MKIQVTKAQTLELKPNTNYAIFLTFEPELWSSEQQQELEARLPWAKVVWLPKGTKVKIMEENNDAKQEKQDRKASEASTKA